jgi:hypothetical protein
VRPSAEERLHGERHDGGRKPANAAARGISTSMCTRQAALRPRALAALPPRRTSRHGKGGTRAPPPGPTWIKERLERHELPTANHEHGQGRETGLRLREPTLDPQDFRLARRSRKVPARKREHQNLMVLRSTRQSGEKK